MKLSPVRGSMMSHLKERPHLIKQQRLRASEVRGFTGGRGFNDILRPNKESLQYDDSYWYRERGARKLRPEQESFLDTDRLDSVKAKFDTGNYDMGQFKYIEEELYCEICDVRIRSRDHIQAHSKKGAYHKKKSGKVQRYQCLIQVPCQDTLDNHLRGKDHIKRQLQEQRRERGEVEESVGGGYKTGPREMVKLINSKRVELIQLRKTNKILRDKYQEKQWEFNEYKREFGTQVLKELGEKVRWCQEEHIGKLEFERKGIFCKKEEGEDYQPPPSRRVKQEKEEQREVKMERVKNEANNNEYVERDIWGEMADRMTKLHNLYIIMKVEFPEISFESESIAGTLGGKTIWKGTGEFLGTGFVGEGNKKSEVKMDVCEQVVRCIEAGNFGEELQISYSSPSQPLKKRKRRRGCVGAKSKEARREKFIEKHSAS